MKKLHHESYRNAPEYPTPDPERYLVFILGKGVHVQDTSWMAMFIRTWFLSSGNVLSFLIVHSFTRSYFQGDISGFVVTKPIYYFFARMIEENEKYTHFNPKVRYLFKWRI